MRNRFQTIASFLVLAVVVLELMLIVGSWLGSAVTTSLSIRSLLSAEGVRWYLGAYSEVMATPVLVWLLSVGIAYGLLLRSELLNAMLRSLRSEPMGYFERLSLRATSVVFCSLVGVVIFITFAPHAVLLSATGTISNSSFSAGIVTIVGFLLSITALTYGLCASQFKSLNSIFDAMVYGVTQMVPLVILYLFIAHLILTIGYVVS